MPPYPLLNDTNAVKQLILEQAKQIECLKRQLEQYKWGALTEAASASSPIVSSASSTPTPPTSITSDITSGPIVDVKCDDQTVISVGNDQFLSPLPSVKSKDQIELPSASPNTLQRRVFPLQNKESPTLKKKLQLNQLPSKQTFKKRIKTAIELDGYNRDVHFQHLIYQDSKLPSRTKNARWNFAFRFCSYFVLSGRKIFVKTLIHGNKKDNKKTSISSFPGLHAFLQLKRIDATLLEKPLAGKTVAHFITPKHQLEIVKFLYAFCSLLYAFLPQEKRVYKVISNASEFHLSANDKTSDQAEEEEEKEEEDKKEIKEEVNYEPKFIKSGSKTEGND